MMREAVSLWLVPRDNKIQDQNFFPRMSKCLNVLFMLCLFSYSSLLSFQLSEPLSLGTLTKLDFLGKVVKESARKRPVMVISTPEYVTCPMVIGNFQSPPGVSSDQRAKAGLLVIRVSYGLLKRMNSLPAGFGFSKAVFKVRCHVTYLRHSNRELKGLFT